MFNTYPASKCTTSDIYKCVYASLVVCDILRTVLGSLKEERKKKENEQFAWATISVYCFIETSVSRAKGIFKLGKFA